MKQKVQQLTKDWLNRFFTDQNAKLREAIIREKKRFFVKSFRKRGGGSDWFHTSILFFQTPSKTLQTPCNTLQAPLKHPSTPFKQPSKSSFFFDQKMVGKKINRDFIKGGRGGGSPFYEVISQKIFFSRMTASLISIFSVYHMLFYCDERSHKYNLFLPTSPEVWNSMDQPLPGSKQQTPDI